MCFSATASFSVALTTGVIGVAAVKHVNSPRELPLAIVPLLFALQQAVEGVIWLQLSGGGDGDSVAALSMTFLVFAQVVWPTFTALAVLLIEPERRRRIALYAIAIVGGFLSLHLLASLLGEPPMATIRGQSIAYTSHVNPLSWLQIPYLICTCAPLLISSHRIIQFFGAVVLAGFAVSAYVYFAAFISVWCFFAATGSALLYFYFRHAAVAARHRYT